MDGICCHGSSGKGYEQSGGGHTGFPDKYAARRRLEEVERRQVVRQGKREQERVQGALGGMGRGAGEQCGSPLLVIGGGGQGEIQELETGARSGGNREQGRVMRWWGRSWFWRHICL